MENGLFTGIEIEDYLLMDVPKKEAKRLVRIADKQRLRSRIGEPRLPCIDNTVWLYVINPNDEEIRELSKEYFKQTRGKI